MVRLRTESEVGESGVHGETQKSNAGQDLQAGTGARGYLNVPPQATGIKEVETLKGRK